MTTATAEPGIHPNQARQHRVELALGNPVFFGEYYLRPFDPVWKEAGPLPRFSHEMLAFAMQVARGVVIAAPETLKTTTLCLIEPLWRTYGDVTFGRLRSGMLVSEAESLAKKNLSVITWHIENNERLASDFRTKDGRPLVRPSEDEAKWTDQRIIVARAGASKDPTWEAVGLDTILAQGARLHYLRGDDVVTPRSAGSAAIQEKAINLIDTQFTMRLVEGGSATFSGNFNHARDLVSNLAAREAYAVLKRPALHVKGKPHVAPEDPTDPDAIEGLPEKWPRARLEQQRREKPNRFRRIFLLDSHAEQGERLKVEWVTLLDEDEVDVKGQPLGFSIDPAPGGEGENTDFFNLSVGIIGKEHLDVIVSHDMRGTISEQVDLVTDYYDHFMRRAQVRWIGGAKVALDRYFRGALTIARSDIGSKLVEVSIPGSKEERLEGLGPFAKSGYLRIRRAVWTELTSAAADRHQELSLFEQWRDLPALTHDDKLDGLDVLVRSAQEFAGMGEAPVEIEV